jgi:polysaccharide pyruvyl transferase WcaK-like protein
MKIYKPIMYYHVDTSNRGDWVIKKSIVEAIQKRINIPFAFMSVKNDELTEPRILKQLNTDCSALMIAGSGLYTNYPKSSGWYFPCKTELFEKIKVPIMLVGLGCNQNLKGNVLNSELKDEVKQSIKLINDLAVVSTVRDQHTYDILSGLGINRHRLMLDPANFLDVKRRPKEKRVAIQIAQHAPILGRFDGTTELRTYNIECFAKISRHLIENGYSVVFIAHDALENSLIVDLKAKVSQIEYLNSDNLDEMLAEYARCEFTIAVKMHSCIMSFASGTPIINVYYDKKSIEYLEMIGCEDMGINIFDKYYYELKNKVNDMMLMSNSYAQHIEQIRTKEQPKFNQMIEDICNLIKTSN